MRPVDNFGPPLVRHEIRTILKARGAECAATDADIERMAVEHGGASVDFGKCLNHVLSRLTTEQRPEAECAR